VESAIDGFSDLLRAVEEAEPEYIRAYRII
jgi:hypothetical protein